MAYFEQTQLKDTNKNAVNPATEESLILLRRIAKMLEPSATQDTAGRQRVAVEGTSTVTVSASTNLIGYVGVIGDTRIDLARAAYESVRSRLIFT